MARRKTRTKTPELNTIGFTGDWHCGSHHGLLPPKYWSDKTPQAIRWMWECFDHMVKTWPKLDLLMLTGDLIDGTQGKSKGTGLYTSDLSEQAEIAIECMVASGLNRKAAAVRRVEGTQYHEGFGGTLKFFDMAMNITPQHAVKAVVQNENEQRLAFEIGLLERQRLIKMQKLNAKDGEPPVDIIFFQEEFARQKEQYDEGDDDHEKQRNDSRTDNGRHNSVPKTKRKNNRQASKKTVRRTNKNQKARRTTRNRHRKPADQ